MRKKMMRAMLTLACLGSVAQVGCDMRRVNEILAAGIVSTTVDLGELFIESAVNNAFNLDQP